MAHPVAMRPSPRPAAAMPALVALAAGIAVAGLAAAVPGWGGVLTVLWICLAAVAWRFPVVAVAVVALAVPFEQRLAFPMLAGDVTAMQYTGWALVAGSLPRLAGVRRVAIDRVGLLHAAIIVALVASIAAGDVRLLTWWHEVRGWLLAGLVYLVARSLAMEPRQRHAVVAALAAGVMLNAAQALSQLVTGAGPASFTVGGAVRVFGTFTHPNTLASYLAFVVPMLIALSLAPARPVAWIARIAALAGVVTLVLTQSRGGMLALGVALIALVALAPRSIQQWAALGGIALALAVVAGGLGASVPGIERFSTISASNGPTQVTPATWGQLEREAHWGAAWSMLKSDPLFGVGAGEFNDNYREHTPSWRFRVGRGHAHNAYLHLGAEAGVPGLTAYAAWVGTILVALGRRLARTTGIDYLFAAGALGAALAWAVDGIFEYQEVPSILIVFVMLIALGLSDASPARSRAGGIGSTGAAT
jgi:O-antigen ligase